MIKRVLSFIVLIVFCSIGTVQFVYAWTNDGIGVSLSTTSSSKISKLASDGQGGAFIVWENSLSGNKDIYAQSVDSTGKIKWRLNGIVICTTKGDQLNYQIVSDGHGGAVIVWEDNRDSNCDIYAQAIDSTGKVKWDENGIAVCSSANEQNYPCIVNDGQGGAIIAWKDSRNGTPYVYAQSVNSTGKFRWAVNGIAICTVYSTTEPKIVSDLNQGAIIAWFDGRNGDPDLYAQKVNKDGVFQWVTNGVAICTVANEQYDLHITGDEQGGAIMVWMDQRSMGSAIYVQAINSDGYVKWSTNGVFVVSSVKDPGIVSDLQGGAVISWIGDLNSYKHPYVRAIDSNGVFKWNARCMSNSLDEYNQTIPNIISNNKGGAIVVWLDNRFYPPWIYAQSIDSAGTIQWRNNGLKICTTYYFRGYIDSVSDGNEGLIFSWTHNYNQIYTSDIYIQGIKKKNSIVYDVVAVPGDKKVHLIWNNPIGRDYYATKILRRTDRYPTNPTDGTVIYWYNGGEFWDTGLINGQTYYYSIFAHDTSYSYSSGVSVSATPMYKYNVTNVVVKPGDHKLTLTWSNPTVESFLATKIMRRTDQYPADPSDGTQVFWFNEDYCTDTGLVNGETYYYTIFAHDYDYSFASGIRVSGVPSYNENVENLEITPGDRMVLLKWTNPAIPDYSATKILRRSDHYPASPTDGTQVYWYNGTVCLDTGLTNGQTYYYGLYTHDTVYSYSTGVFKSVYLSWQSSEGSFETSLDTVNWVFQKTENETQMPAYHWLSNYSGHTGILKINYSNATEGLKLTAVNRLYNGVANNWYHIRVQYASDSPNHGHEIIAQLLSYPGHQSNTITEVGGNWTGNGQIASHQWYTYDAYMYSKESSQQVQLILKNKGHSGAFYIDSIECDSAVPPAVTSPILVPMTIGDFDTGADMAGWAFEKAAGSTGKNMYYGWTTSELIQNSFLFFEFSMATQGIKITSIPVYNIDTHRNVLLSFKIHAMDYINPPNIIGYLYGEHDLADFKVDLAGKATFRKYDVSLWNTFYVPLTSISGNTSFRIQIVIKKNAYSEEFVHLDDVQLYYSPAISASSQWVELLDDPIKEENRNYRL